MTDRGDFGDGSRWLINKCSDHPHCWLLHEPINPNSLKAQCFPTFEGARAAFVAFSAFDEMKERQP